MRNEHTVESMHSYARQATCNHKAKMNLTNASSYHSFSNSRWMCFRIKSQSSVLSNSTRDWMRSRRFRELNPCALEHYSYVSPTRVELVFLLEHEMKFPKHVPKARRTPRPSTSGSFAYQPRLPSRELFMASMQCFPWVASHPWLWDPSRIKPGFGRGRPQ